MKLQTQISLKKQSKNLLDYSSNIFLLGSCFSNNIGDKMAYFKLKNLQNPFGILFHPKAIENLIQQAVSQKEYNKNDVFDLNEQWHSFEAHSKLSHSSKDVLLKTLNHQIDKTNKQLIKSTHVVITLGTAWGYRHRETDKFIANCHKAPQKEFEKVLLSIDEIEESLRTTINLIKHVNPKVCIIFTVSPVRHLKDGFVENMQSKAHLIASIHRIISANKNLYYFPSYEIMMDELRDYRFYKEDMIHPNTTAINCIWEKFQQVWICDKASKIMEDVDYIQKAINHKPVNPNSKAYIKFLENIETKKLNLKMICPDIYFK